MIRVNFNHASYWRSVLTKLHFNWLWCIVICLFCRFPKTSEKVVVVNLKKRVQVAQLYKLKIIFQFFWLILKNYRTSYQKQIMYARVCYLAVAIKELRIEHVRHHKKQIKDIFFWTHLEILVVTMVLNFTESW